MKATPLPLFKSTRDEVFGDVAFVSDAARVFVLRVALREISSGGTGFKSDTAKGTFTSRQQGGAVKEIPQNDIFL